MASKEDDYTKYRTPGVIPFGIDDKIGRSDSKDKIATTAMTIGTTATLLPVYPLGRRNFIRIKNLDAVNNIYILTASGTTFSGGYQVPAGTEWEESTDAVIWAMADVGTIDVEIYERSSRFNYA